MQQAFDKTLCPVPDPVKKISFEWLKHSDWLEKVEQPIRMLKRTHFYVKLIMNVTALTDVTTSFGVTSFDRMTPSHYFFPRFLALIDAVTTTVRTAKGRKKSECNWRAMAIQKQIERNPNHNKSRKKSEPQQRSKEVQMQQMDDGNPKNRRSNEVQTTRRSKTHKFSKHNYADTTGEGTDKVLLQHEWLLTDLGEAPWALVTWTKITTTGGVST